MYERSHPRILFVTSSPCVCLFVPWCWWCWGGGALDPHTDMLFVFHADRGSQGKNTFLSERASSLRSEMWKLRDSYVLGTFVGAEHSSTTSQDVKVTQMIESPSLAVGMTLSPRADYCCTEILFGFWFCFTFTTADRRLDSATGSGFVIYFYVYLLLPSHVFTYPQSSTSSDQFVAS